MTANLMVTATGAEASCLQCIGSVADVIAGHVPKELQDKSFKAADYSYGFELASPVGLSSMGEAVIVNKQCYATATDSAASDYKQVIAGPTFVTSGCLLIPHQAKPSHQVVLTESSSPQELGQLYNDIYQQIQQPFAMVGFLEFAACHYTFVTKAPIRGENIFENQASYYNEPAKTKPDARVFIVGALTDFNAVKFAALNKKLTAVLYNNPNEASTALNAHAHALIIDKSVTTESAITPQTVEQVVHLYADKSIVKSAQLKIFTINNMGSGLDI